MPIAALWFIAERLGIMEARQFAALFLLWLLVVACFGVPIARAMAAPLAYLIFLVPFGAFLVPALQGFTARFIDLGLDVLAIPHVVTATLIEIPEGRFEVAEACAGLRFLIATIAFGALYALTFYRSAWRRCAYLAACVLVPILANGVRALGIVLIGHREGTDSAVVVDHVLYGWVFFSLIIVLLLLIGLPFREDAPRLAVLDRPPRPDRPADRRTQTAALAAGLAIVALGATGPAAAAVLDRLASRQTARLQSEADRLAASLTIPPGCTEAAAQGDRRTLTCDGTTVETRVAVFAPLDGPAAIHAWRDATAPADDETSQSWRQGAWHLTSIPSPPMTRAAMLRLGGAPAPGGLALRLRLALAPFRAAAPPAVLTMISGAAHVEAVVRAQR